MAEVLEIQIQDKGSAGMSGAPRPPSAGMASASPAPPAPGPSSAFGAPKAPMAMEGKDLIGDIANQLGFGRLYKAVHELMGTSATQAPSPPKPPQLPTATQAPSPPKPPQLPTTATAPPMPPRLHMPEKPTPPLAPPSASATPPAAGSAAATAGVEGAEAAGGMEALGGAMSGLAAAAGPIGAALVVADVAAKATAQAFDNVRDNIEGFGHQVALAAGNDYLGMFKSGLQAIHSPLKDIPIVGQIYESQLQAAIAPVKAFTEVVEAFNHRASELAGWSPALMMAETRGDIRSMFDDIKEAQQLGPDLARMVDAENDLTHQFRELLLPIKKAVVEGLADIIDLLAEIVTFFHKKWDSIQEWMKEHQAVVLAAKMAVHALPLVGPILTSLEAIKNFFDKSGKSPDTDFLRELLDLKLPDFGAPDHLPRDARPNIPIVDHMP